jgi:hypothetical protein
VGSGGIGGSEWSEEILSELNYSAQGISTIYIFFIEIFFLFICPLFYVIIFFFKIFIRKIDLFPHVFYKGFSVDTKIYSGCHKGSSVAKSTQESIIALNTTKVCHNLTYNFS